MSAPSRSRFQDQDFGAEAVQGQHLAGVDFSAHREDKLRRQALVGDDGGVRVSGSGLGLGFGNWGRFWGLVEDDGGVV